LFRSFGIKVRIDFPIISFRLYPKMRWALWFQSVMIPFKSFATTASCDDWTTAANRIAAISMCSRSFMSVHSSRVEPAFSLALALCGFLVMLEFLKSRQDLAGDALNLRLMLRGTFVLFIGGGTNPGRLGTNGRYYASRI